MVLHRSGCSGGGVAEVQAMTISDLDIYRSANLLVKQHGPGATAHAALRADAMLERGDLDGQAVWLRIMRAAGGVASGTISARRGGTLG